MKMSVFYKRVLAFKKLPECRKSSESDAAPVLQHRRREYQRNSRFPST